MINYARWILSGVNIALNPIIGSNGTDVNELFVLFLEDGWIWCKLTRQFPGKRTDRYDKNMLTNT